jgi:TRAP-type C4-dicarboxylate transport system permease small subunit
VLSLKVSQIAYVASVLAAGLIAADMMLQVFFRYVMNNSLQWSEEAGIYLMIWMVFLGSSLLMKKSEHISLTALIRKFPVKITVAVTLFSRIIVLIFLVFLVYYGFKIFASKVGAVSPGLHINVRWVKLAIPIGGIFIIFDSIYLLITEIEHLVKNDLDYFRHGDVTPSSPTE